MYLCELSGGRRDSFSTEWLIHKNNNNTKYHIGCIWHVFDKLTVAVPAEETVSIGMPAPRRGEEEGEGGGGGSILTVKSSERINKRRQTLAENFHKTITKIHSSTLCSFCILYIDQGVGTGVSDP